MSDDPQGQEQLVAVRYTDGQPRIINGETVSAGDVVYLPVQEVELWPTDRPHPYYERADGDHATAKGATLSVGVSEEAVAAPSRAPRQE